MCIIIGPSGLSILAYRGVLAGSVTLGIGLRYDFVFTFSQSLGYYFTPVLVVPIQPIGALSIFYNKLNKALS